jgi:hypothetical protein
MNFKSDNYTGVSTIIPTTLKLQEQKPGFILNKILEDFKSCIEIPSEKRPDSLFPQSGNEFTIKLPFSKMVTTHLSELLEKTIPRPSSGLLAIDIIYDQPATCEKILSLLGNLTSFKTFEIAGIISAHGFNHTSYLKSMEQWRCFSDGKLYPWVNIVWQICSSSSSPVLIVLSSSLLKNSPCFMSKVDMDSIEKFCKLQDSRVKLTFKEEFVEYPGETTTRVITERRLESQDETLKEYSLDYIRKTQEILKKDLSNFQTKQEQKPYRLEKGYRVFTPNMVREPDVKEEVFQYKRVVQDYRPSSSSAVNIQSRGRNYSTDPAQSKLSSSRSQKDDLLYKPVRTSSIDPKDSGSRPGILKNSTGDSRFSKGIKPSSPVFSPREPNSSRALKESYSDRFDEEITEKPSSILRNGWMSDRKLENIEKKVNFSEDVFRVDNSIKGQMPEIKLSSVKFSEKPSSKTPDFKLQSSEPRLLIPYKPSDLSQSLQKIESLDNWTCPKCSKIISGGTFECVNCRFINWDKFYSLKSKGNKTRAESIPIKTTAREEVSKSRFFELRSKDLRGKGEEIKVQDTYVTDLLNRKSARDYQFNR